MQPYITYCFYAVIAWLALTITIPIIGASRKIGARKPFFLSFIWLILGMYLQGQMDYTLACIIYVVPNFFTLIIALASARKTH